MAGFGDLGGGSGGSSGMNFGFGSTSQKANSTQQTMYPDWYTAQQQGLINTGNGMLGNFLRNPNYSVAGNNPDQETAFDMARHTMINTYDTPGLNATGRGQVTGAGIQGMMNPFLQGVIDPTVQNMRKGYETNRAEIGARAAASGGFGGSREAVQGAALDRNFGDQLAQTVSTLMAQGYDKASALALANAQNGLSEVTTNNNLLNSRQQREMASVQQLLGIGNQQQQLDQSALDAPWTALARLLQITPNLSQTNNTQTKTGTSDTDTKSFGSGDILKGIGQISSALAFL